MGIFKKVFTFYYEGFKNMTIGKTLWGIILLKLFIMFAVLKIFFFKPHLETGVNAITEEEKADYVLEELLNRN